MVRALAKNPPGADSSTIGTSNTCSGGGSRSAMVDSCIADLIGCPVRVTVGTKTREDESVDVLVRATRAEERVRVNDVPVHVEGLL